MDNFQQQKNVLYTVIKEWNKGNIRGQREKVIALYHVKRALNPYSIVKIKLLTRRCPVGERGGLVFRKALQK